MRGRSETLSFIALALAVSTAACGSDGTPSPAGAGPAAATDAPAEVLTDSRLDTPDTTTGNDADAEAASETTGDASAFLGTPVALSSTESAPHAIAVDGTDVYWTNSGDGSVVTCHTDGTARTPLVTGRTKPWALAIDATKVYYSDLGTFDVRLVPRAGGADGSLHGTVGTIQSLADDVGSIAAAGQESPGSGVITHILKTSSVSLDQTFSGAHPLGIAVDGSTTYFTNDDVGKAGAVVVIPDFVHPATATLADGLSHPTGIARDTDALYVASSGDGRIVKVGKDPSAPTSTNLSEIEAGPMWIVVDATSIYWTNDGDGTVVSMDKTTHVRRVLATGQKNPDGIAVTPEALYWVNRGDGRVMKLMR